MQPVSLKSNYYGWSHQENALSLLTDMLKKISSHTLMCLRSHYGAVANPQPTWGWLWPTGMLPDTAASSVDKDCVTVYCGS